MELAKGSVALRSVPVSPSSSNYRAPLSNHTFPHHVQHTASSWTSQPQPTHQLVFTAQIQTAAPEPASVQGVTRVAGPSYAVAVVRMKQRPLPRKANRCESSSPILTFIHSDSGKKIFVLSRSPLASCKKICSDRYAKSMLEEPTRVIGLLARQISIKRTLSQSASIILQS